MGAVGLVPARTRSRTGTACQAAGRGSQREEALPVFEFLSQDLKKYMDFTGLRAPPAPS